MSKELQVTNAAALPVVQRAILALGLTDEKKAELEALAARTATITAITNSDGYKQVHAGRMALKNERIDLQKMAKAARQEAVDFSKAVIAQENIAVGIIEPEEKRLQALQDEHDDKEARAKQEKIDAELKRRADIEARITDIRSPVGPATRFNAKSADIAVYIADTERHVIDDFFEELRQQAEEAKKETLAALREAHAAALAREEQQRGAEKAQAEIARLKAEQQEREATQAAERAERERVEREAREKREAEERRKEEVQARITAMRNLPSALSAWNADSPVYVREIAKIEAVAIDESFGEFAEQAKDAKAATLARLREQHDAVAAREAEAAAERERLAEVARQQKAEQDRIDAENKRIANERAELERQQKAARDKAEAEATAERKRKEEAEKLAKKSKYPGDKAIMDVLMSHFGVTEAVVSSWLGQLRKVA